MRKTGKTNRTLVSLAALECHNEALKGDTAAPLCSLQQCRSIASRYSEVLSWHTFDAKGHTNSVMCSSNVTCVLKRWFCLVTVAFVHYLVPATAICIRVSFFLLDKFRLLTEVSSELRSRWPRVHDRGTLDAGAEGCDFRRLWWVLLDLQPRTNVSLIISLRILKSCLDGFAHRKIALPLPSV